MTWAKSVFIFQVLADTDAERTFAEKPAPEIDCEFAMLRIFAHTRYERLQTDIFCHAKSLKAGPVTYKIFRAFHSANNVFYLLQNFFLHIACLRPLSPDSPPFSINTFLHDEHSCHNHPDTFQHIHRLFSALK